MKYFLLCFFIAQVNAPHPPCQCDEYENGAGPWQYDLCKEGMIQMMDGFAIH